MKTLCTWIWNASEFLHISLGRFAPFVFGKMIGAKGEKQNGTNA